MATTKFTTSTAVIAGLADLPNATSGLTPAQLKAKFDESATAIKTYINDVLTVEIDAGSTAGSGALTTHKTSSDHDGRYYTETELNAGQLDTRYYTETEIDANLVTKTDLTTTRKLSATGDFTGTLNGVAITAVDPGLSSAFAALEADVVQRGVNVKAEYGAIGDGIFRTISSVFPSVTLTDVQALNATATLDRAADWYAIQKAISEHESVFIPVGNYMTDLPLVIALDTVCNIQGVHRKSYIYQLAAGKNGFEAYGFLNMVNVIVEGKPITANGIFISKSGCLLEKCEFNGNGGYGVAFDTTNHVVFARIYDTYANANKLGGFHCVTNTTWQKTAIHFDRCYAVGNGNQTDSAVAQTSGGDGFYIGAALGVTITNSVCEYNHGSGIVITTEGLYGVFSFVATGNYFEGNRYANLYVNDTDTARIFKNLLIKGNYYSYYPAVPPTYYTNSILTQGYEAIIASGVNITNSIIEDQFFSFESHGVTITYNVAGGILSVPNRIKTARITGYTDNESYISFASVSCIIARNIADANPVLVAQNLIGGYTGNLFEAKNGVTTRFSVPGVGGYVNISASKTPASATAAGTMGDICWDASYVYVCTAANTWKRTAIATW